MNAKQGIKRINWFLAVIAALSLIKIWMVQGLVIYPIPAAACDDALMADWALNIAGGKWTGPFNNYIFMKEVGFAIYLAVLHRLHLSYITGTTLLYIAGCMILLYGISHVVQKKWLLCVIYTVTLFHPIMTAVETGQRVYRNGFAVTLLLWLFGSLLNLYFEIREESFRRNCIWAVLAAGSLGFLWETKSDTIWILPFTLVILAVAAGILIKNRKEARPFPKLILLCMPFLGILFFSKTIDLLNTIAYGDTGIPYYGPAMGILTGVESENPIENVSLPRETLQRLYELSPTLASAKDEIEDAMDRYDEADTHPKDGNVEDGWIGWALLRGFDGAGCYKDCRTANKFFENVYEELHEAAEQGELKLAKRSFADAYHIADGKERKELLSAIGQCFQYVAGHQYLFSDICSLEGDDIAGSQRFELLTRNHAYYGMFDTDYYCVGWAAFPQYDLKELKVYIENAEGHQFVQLDFEESPDVKEKYPQAEGAEKCRYVAEWDGGGKENTDFFLVAYEKEQQVVKARITQTGLADVSEEECVGSIDGFFQQGGQQMIRQEAQKAADRCNIVYNIYHFFCPILALAGAAAYAVFTVLSVLEWRKRQYDTVNLWLIITGIGLSLLILFLGVAVTHLEKCPAISYMYLSAAYPMLNLAAMLSLAGCAAVVMRLVQKKETGMAFQ